MFVIEDNVPMPSRGSGRYSGLLPAIKNLKPSQSLFVPLDGTKRTKNSISGFVSIARQRSGGKFTTRSVEGGIRIWRIE